MQGRTFNGEIAPCILHIQMKFKDCFDKEIGLAHMQSRNLWLHWRRCQGRKHKGFGTLLECLTSCDRFVCSHWTWSSCKGDKLYQEEIALAKLVFQVSLTGCSYTYKLSNQNLYFQVGVPICCCPIYQYISRPGPNVSPHTHWQLYSKGGLLWKMITFWKVQ